MRFMLLYKPGREFDAPHGEDYAAAVEEWRASKAGQKMHALMQEMTKAGVLLAKGGLYPTAKGARVSISEGKFMVTDGPFAETKELIAGYTIVEAKSKAEAIELAKRFLEVTGEGENEIRLMHEEAGFDA
jgi:hypothetical protein